VSRRTVLRWIDRAFEGAGPGSAWRWLTRDRLTILMYHRVLDATDRMRYPLPELVVTDETFEKQAAWLAGHAAPVTVSEGLARIEAREQSSRPMVAVTFDDGYADNAGIAAPILEHHGLAATFFVTTGFVAGRSLWFDRAATAWSDHGPMALADATGGGPAPTSLDAWLTRLKHLGTHGRAAALERLGIPDRLDDGLFSPMTVEQIRVLASAGHEIGSHTVTHPILPGLDVADARRELADSRDTLGRWIGRSVRGLAYPNGDHDDAIRHLARSAGYAWAVSTGRGANSAGTAPMRLRRRCVGPAACASIAAFSAEVAGLHDLLRGHGSNRR